MGGANRKNFPLLSSVSICISRQREIPKCKTMKGKELEQGIGAKRNPLKENEAEEEIL